MICCTRAPLALLTASVLVLGGALSAQEDYQPFPWQWDPIGAQVVEGIRLAQGFEQLAARPIDPRSCDPDRFLMSREIHSLVALLEVDLRHLQVLFDHRDSRGWRSSATRIVRKGVTANAANLEKLWNERPDWRAVLVPSAPARRALEGLLAVLLHSGSSPALVGWWSGQHNHGRVRGLYAEFAEGAPKGQVNGQWVFEQGVALTLRTGYLLADGRRYPSSWGLTLSGARAEPMEGGFRLEGLEAGEHELRVQRAGLAPVVLPVFIQADRIELALGGGSFSAREDVAMQLRLASGRPIWKRDIQFDLQRLGRYRRWEPLAVQPEQLAGAGAGAWAWRRLARGSYRVRARHSACKASEWVRFEVRSAALVLALEERHGPAWPVTFSVREESGRPFGAGGGLHFELQREVAQQFWWPIEVEPRAQGAPGRFAYARLEPGRYRLQVSGANYSSSPWVAFEVARAHIELHLTQPGPGERGVTFGVGAAGWPPFAPGDPRLRCQLERRAGDRWVGVSRRPQPSARTPGFLSLRGLDGGTYRLQVGCEGFEPSRWVSFTIVARHLVVQVDVVGAGGRLALVVRDQRGGAVTGGNLRFELQREVPARGWQQVSAQPGALRSPGAYRYERLIPARYRLRVHGEGYTSSEWVEARIAPARLRIDLPKDIYRPGETVRFKIAAAGGRSAALAPIFTVQRRAAGGRSGAMWQPAPRLVPRRSGAGYELGGLGAGQQVRLRVQDTAAGEPSGWVMFTVAPAPPRSKWVQVRPSNGWRKRPSQIQIPAGKWDRGEGVVLFSPEDSARLSEKLMLRAERDEFLVIDSIAVDGRDSSGRVRSARFFEPRIYDVSRFASRGYRFFEYLTPRGREFGDGVYICKKPEVPTAPAGVSWPPFARRFLLARKALAHPQRAYVGGDRHGKPQEGQYGILALKSGTKREQGKILLTLPWPLHVERIRLRRFASNYALLSVHVEVRGS